MEITDIKFLSELQREVRNAINNYHTKVYAEINGKAMYLNEYEVRFLMLRKTEYCTTPEKFSKWCESVKIWDGRFKHKSQPMRWSENNSYVFTTKFQNGFLDAAGLLHIKLLQLNKKINSATK